MCKLLFGNIAKLHLYVFTDSGKKITLYIHIMYIYTYLCCMYISIFKMIRNSWYQVFFGEINPSKVVFLSENSPAAQDFNFWCIMKSRLWIIHQRNDVTSAVM